MKTVKEKLNIATAASFNYSSVQVAIGRVLSVTFAFLVNALLARILDPSDVGDFIYLQTLVLLTATISLFGQNQVVIRVVGEKKLDSEIEAKKATSHVVSLAFLVAILISVILYFFYPIFSARKNVGEAIVAILNLLFFMQLLLSDVFRSWKLHLDAILFGGLLSTSIFLLCLSCVYFCHVKTDYSDVVFIYVASQIMPLVIAVKKIKKITCFCKSKNDFIKYMRIGFPILITAALVMVINQGGVFIVAGLLSKEELALYGMAGKISGLLMFVTQIFYSVLPPLIVEKFNAKDFIGLESLLRKSALISSLVMLMPMLLIVVFPDYVMDLIFGDYYSHASSVLIVLSIGSFFNVLTGIRGYVLMITGFEKIQTVITFFGGGLSLILTYLFAQNYGVIGAAIGCVIDIVCQCLMEMFVVKQKLGIYTHLCFSGLNTQVNHG